MLKKISLDRKCPRHRPPSFFDDDGRVYFLSQCQPETLLWPKHRNIWLQEINPTTWELIVKRTDIVTPACYFGKEDKKCLGHFEGPYLYKHKDSYYDLLSHGGTYLEPDRFHVEERHALRPL